MTMKDKNILLCVTGSIAAYKSIDLYRRLVKEGANVEVIISEGGSNFVPPFVFESFGESVYTDDAFKYPLAHISLSKFADLILIAPATFNTINKIASGIADSLITLVVSASSDTPKLVVPSMNSSMYSNKILQDNIKKLEEYNFYSMKPAEGGLACGDIGEGKFPEIEDIMFEIERVFAKKVLSGKRVLVTAGGTREYLDPVRFLSNGSSGRMGIALANEAIKAGAIATLISLNIEKSCHYINKGIRNIECRDFSELRQALGKEFKKTDILIMAAAVSDFSFKTKSSKKIKKTGLKKSLEIIPNEDLLKMLSKEKRKNQLLMGFAAEDAGILENGIKKLKEKSLDYIFINDISRNIIGKDENEGILIKKTKKGILKKIFERQAKKMLASKLISEIGEKT